MPGRRPRRRRPGARGRDGFSIIEVLAAMIILAVGLMALQAMAIGAAQRTAAANRQMAFTLIAGEHLEQDLATFESGGMPQSRQPTRADGVPVAIVVTPTVDVVTAVQIAVTVTPPEDGRFPLQPITVVGSAFRP